MPPRPDDRARTELQALVTEASKRRDAERLRAETEFWAEIDRLQRRYHGAQQDIADALGIKRNQILRQTKRYRTDQTTNTDS
ncbi:hypothetical protein [Streptomyces sp. Vc17.3-30]|uniref:hypothetical protein n=1 Tax=Streptomyces sp. Vc17.3-30 TaxID=2841672 RepID=UPI0020956A27|nr:hypothetical protein [Streptomyces sp. Vc17.3-30]MCO6698848.1 hypothetical protein [Streptomyces sp. Vc17.3-30]